MLCLTLGATASHGATAQEASQEANQNGRLKYERLPDLPTPVGVAGPIVGVHRDLVIVGGGANFAPPEDPRLWEVPKLYHDQVWILERVTAKDSKPDLFAWRKNREQFNLSQKVAYPAVVNTQHGILVMGGEDSTGPTKRTFLLGVTQTSKGDSDRKGEWTLFENDKIIPDLPLACTSCSAAVIGNFVYLVAGQVEDGESKEGAGGNRAASRIVWRLNLDCLSDDQHPEKEIVGDDRGWELVVGWPESGAPRMFPLVAAQHDGFTNRLFVFGGRHFPAGTDTTNLRNLKFLSDGWSFDPTRYSPELFNAATGDYAGENPWRRIADSPQPLTAGTVVPFGPAHLIVPAYATGEALGAFLDTGLEMKDYAHPGFPKEALTYHAITDTWASLGKTPAAQVTTPAVRWGDDIVLVSGEVRPRVRSANVWRIQLPEQKSNFGVINMSVVVVYLLCMLGIGVYFTKRNKSTDDFFRGGKSIPWWAAGCSIFATMLSSITYMAVPAKAFAQDWVYAVGNVLILAVAPIAIYVALPFFRRIDATSAYEYLEKRFNRSVRLIGSGCFSLFHVFRMGVVLALAALALSSVTPLSAAQCVVVMGGLSIIYCTFGGIEAVIWTDTIQTFILIGGALLCICFALLGSESGSFAAAIDSQKFNIANLDFGMTSFSTMAIWVVVLGGFGQNLASYTADQAVVQRYMTTPDEKQAARSIWLNGLMAIPAGIIFFGMGTAFWMFYRSHPDKLDPSIAADRIMPLFISQELPIGLAGLVVAGIFAAAQSTVSTSMNSGATTIVTDFIRPLSRLKSERVFLWVARLVTLAMGFLGTVAGLYFVDPEIKSLFDQFISILGMFLGVLAGLFALGATTKRANGTGSLIGAIVSMTIMFSIATAANTKSVIVGGFFRGCYDTIGLEIYRINGYLYGMLGIVICYSVGYIASLIFRGDEKNLTGLTLFTSKKTK